MKKKKSSIGYSVAAASALAMSVILCTGGNTHAEFESGSAPQGWQNRQVPGGTRPDGKQGGPFRSTESVSACKDKSEGDNCSFSVTPPNSESAITIDGTCSKTPVKQGRENDNDSDALSCVPTRNESMGNAPGNKKVSSENRLEKAQSMKERASSRITATQTRLENIVNFLQTKNIDTSEIENDIETLKKKTATVLDRYDALVALLKEDNPSSDSVKETFESVRSAEKAARDYFTGTVRTAIRSVLDTL